jgi:hypothetical protein
MLRGPTDAARTAAAREFADWLEAHGDPSGHAKWFRHPKLHWEVRDGGRAVSWGVHPWDNDGRGGSSSRVDSFWWVCWHPTPAWTDSANCADLVGKWLDNRVDFETWPWTRDVARRIGREAEWVRQVADRRAQAEQNRAMRAEEDAREWAECRRLVAKFGARLVEAGVLAALPLAATPDGGR